MHALPASAVAQASPYRHIRPEYLNNSLPYVLQLLALMHRGAAYSPCQVTRGTSIHGLSGTEDARESPFGCTRPEKANRFILHVAEYVMHSQLLDSDASRSLHASAYTKASHATADSPTQDVDAWPG